MPYFSGTLTTEDAAHEWRVLGEITLYEEGDEDIGYRISGYRGCLELKVNEATDHRKIGEIYRLDTNKGLSVKVIMDRVTTTADDGLLAATFRSLGAPIRAATVRSLMPRPRVMSPAL